MTIRTNRIERYYDTHEIEGEELGQSLVHNLVFRYEIAVLEWFFKGQNVGLVGDLNFYNTPDTMETPTCPDIAVVDGLDPDEYQDEDLPSYHIGVDGPPPRVVIELASKETWRVDLEEKPAKYASQGIREYFAFDPHSRTFWRDQWREKGRLIGWRLDLATRTYTEIKKEKGRLWSEELQSWLAVDGRLLRFYAKNGQLRLTESEENYLRAQAELNQANAERERAERERNRAERERNQANAERERAEQEHNRAEQERNRAEQEHSRTVEIEQELEIQKRRAEALAERLRQLNIDPDNL